LKFPFYKQLDAMDCGPTCLKMVAEHYGRNYSLQSLRGKSHITREGVSMLGISDAAEAIGFRTMGVKASLEKMIEEQPVPFIAHWRQVHFVVVYKIEPIHRVTRSHPMNNHKFHVADPAHGLVTYTTDEFKKYWCTSKQDGEEVGVALLLEPTPAFYELEGEKAPRSSISFLLQYLRPHKKFIVQLFLGLLLGSLLQLILPFLAQSVVDVGITTQNLSFVYLVLIAQVVLMIARMVTEFIRGWILLHISTRINISLISDFLIKLMKLPVGFFDTKMIGDLMQRIGDHRRIEQFLTSETLNILFSFFNVIVFGAVLAYYNWSIFFVFMIGSALYLGWILLFMKKRRELDFKRFQESANNQGNLYQLITGMQEIKLNNCEKQKRWEWERIQAKLFKVSVKGLALSQYQQTGSLFFNEGKNILITIMAGAAVIKGDMTLGMMISVQYITGQLNSPISQMITFMQSWQDAKISLERLSEIHLKEDEEDVSHPRITELPEVKDIHIENLTFQYEGSHSPKVLDNVDLHIPQNKITAIVGASGSGKTTLIKLILGFYPPTHGKITIGQIELENYSQHMWRDRCGVVMQDGFIFSDSIAKNVAVSDEIPDRSKLANAVKVSNIREFIEDLPLSYNTKIGQEGSGISQGQRQRILIARAVYKDPEYIFLDEATNALDANNEKVIMENLNEFFKGRTVIVVAHRLSTVKNADQIIVLDRGKIVETGNHETLTAKKGAYYELVKNQLELGS
jgi:ATP-binding cassette, subfamily B, bacterial